MNKPQLLVSRSVGCGTLIVTSFIPSVIWGFSQLEFLQVPQVALLNSGACWKWLLRFSDYHGIPFIPWWHVRAFGKQDQPYLIPSPGHQFCEQSLWSTLWDFMSSTVQGWLLRLKSPLDSISWSMTGSGAFLVLWPNTKSLFPKCVLLGYTKLCK